MVIKLSKYVHIYDFDDTIYFNPVKLYEQYPEQQRLIDSKLFNFDTTVTNFLITGRYNSENILKLFCKIKGYTFNKIVGNIFNPVGYPLKIYNHIYQYWKTNTILNIFYQYSKLYKGAVSFIVYDDWYPILQILKAYYNKRYAINQNCDCFGILNLKHVKLFYNSLTCQYSVAITSIL